MKYDISNYSHSISMALYKFIVSTAVAAMMLQSGMMCEDEHVWRVRISDRLSSHGRIGKTKTQ